MKDLGVWIEASPDTHIEGNPTGIASREAGLRSRDPVLASTRPGIDG
jgi:hypothetical protein